MGMPTVFGAELSLGLSRPQNGEADPEGHHLLVLARDPEGYARLASTISTGHLAGGEKGKPDYSGVDWAAAHGGHWLVLTGCRKGAVPQALLEHGPAAAARELARLVDVFGADNVVVELCDHGDPLDSARNDALATLAVRAGLPLVATNNVHYAVPARRRLATALAAVRARRSLDDLAGWLPGRRRCPPALGRRAGPPVRPLAGRGRAGGRAGTGLRVRPGAGGAAAPAVPVPRRPRRDDLPAPPRRGGRRPPLRAPRRRRPRRRPRPQPQGLGPDRPRARGHRGARLPRLLPRGVGHRRVLPPVRHLLPGAGQRRQLGGLLRPRRHQRRRGGARPAVRAVPVARARRSARHRHRHRERAAGRGDPARLPPPRAPARGPGGQRHQLPGPLGGARHGQGARLLARPAGRLVEADGHVVDRGVHGRRAGPRVEAAPPATTSPSRCWRWPARSSGRPGTSASTRGAWSSATGPSSTCARSSGAGSRAGPRCATAWPAPTARRRAIDPGGSGAERRSDGGGRRAPCRCAPSCSGTRTTARRSAS